MGVALPGLGIAPAEAGGESGGCVAWPVAEPVGDGESVGDDDAVSVGVDVGLGVADGEGEPADDDPGDGEGEGLAVALADAPALQLVEPCGDALPLRPNGPPPPMVVPELPDDGAPAVEVPPATGLLLLLMDWIMAGGTLVTAKDRPATTRNAAVSEAAGRSHLSLRVSSASGRNRSATSANANQILFPMGSRNQAAVMSMASKPDMYLARQPAAPREGGGPAAIFPRIRCRPSPAGSIESAASRNALLSVCSSMAWLGSGRRWLMPHAPERSAARTSRATCGS